MDYKYQIEKKENIVVIRDIDNNIYIALTIDGEKRIKCKRCHTVVPHISDPANLGDPSWKKPFIQTEDIEESWAMSLIKSGKLNQYEEILSFAKRAYPESNIPNSQNLMDFIDIITDHIWQWNTIDY